MKISDVIKLLDARTLTSTINPDHPVSIACGSDMMSDVLAYTKKDSILLTGLTNPQVIRTSEMLDIVCLVFVRGKTPAPEILARAEELEICVLSTDYTMFDSCGILYQAGMKGGKRTDG